MDQVASVILNKLANKDIERLVLAGILKPARLEQKVRVTWSK